MPAVVTSAAIEEALRRCLSSKGYTLNRIRSNGETGVDIEARKGPETIAIEVIGFKSSAPARSKDFYEAFFRAVSRLNDGASHCVIALPFRFGVGLRARAKQHRIAWNRIGSAFPELQIWLVDPAKEDCYESSAWCSWLE